MSKNGKITQIIGAVVDVNFSLNCQKFIQLSKYKTQETNLILEVAQHLGENDVRTIAMDATEGLEKR